MIIINIAGRRYMPAKFGAVIKPRSIKMAEKGRNFDYKTSFIKLMKPNELIELIGKLYQGVLQ